MTEQDIEYLLEHPYEKRVLEYVDEVYILEEHFEYNGNSIKGQINCFIDDKKMICVDVEISINIQNFQSMRDARFGWLEVPYRIQNKGIGNKLMLRVIETIEVFKLFYNIHEEVMVSGWLSQADKINGNWRVSLPLYEKVADNLGIRCYFQARDTEKKYLSYREFMDNVGSGDGDVCFVV